jgi:hypothetical protein
MRTDEKGVRAGGARPVVLEGIGGGLFALVPGGEGRRPVNLEAGHAALASVLDEVLGGEVQDGGDGGEVGTTPKAQLMETLRQNEYSQAIVESAGSRAHRKDNCRLGPRASHRTGLDLGLRDTEEIVKDFRVSSKLAAVNLEGDRAGDCDNVSGEPR